MLWAGGMEELGKGALRGLTWATVGPRWWPFEGDDPSDRPDWKGECPQPGDLGGAVQQPQACSGDGGNIQAGPQAGPSWSLSSSGQEAGAAVHSPHWPPAGSPLCNASADSASSTWLRTPSLEATSLPSGRVSHCALSPPGSHPVFGGWFRRGAR